MSVSNNRNVSYFVSALYTLALLLGAWAIYALFDEELTRSLQLTGCTIIVGWMGKILELLEKIAKR